MVRLVLMRHGQTEWSAVGRHTSRTDLAMTVEGEREAQALASKLVGTTFEAVLCSPRSRALRTAELAGLTVTAVDNDLAEWNYGEYEGVTTAEIRERRPDWSLWTDGAPGGESPDDVSARIDRVLQRSEHSGRSRSRSSDTATRCGCSPRAGSDYRPATAPCSGSTVGPSRASATSASRRSSKSGTYAEGLSSIFGGRPSYGVERTTVVRVVTLAALRISLRSRSRSAGLATRTRSR